MIQTAPHNFMADEIMQNKFGNVENYSYLCVNKMRKDMKKETEKKTKRVIRFYQRSWVDIVVEVDAEASEEEVFEKASERYNNGEYDDSDTDFENTDYTDVTDYYKENGLPPFKEIEKSPLSDWRNIS